MEVDREALDKHSLLMLRELLFLSNTGNQPQVLIETRKAFSMTTVRLLTKH